MNKLLNICLAAIMIVLSSCLGKTVWDEYKDWRNTNDDWYAQQATSGNYTTIIPSWDPSAQVLMRWHNDTTTTRNNLKPLITSTVDVKYRGRLYNDTPFDSSYTKTSPADSIYRSKVNNNIEGWMIALTHMHVGDSCTIIIPYEQGYGSSSVSSVIRPYSVLVFDMKLVDIYKYKTN